MKMFTIDSKRKIRTGAVAICTASFLAACASAPAAVTETPFETTMAPAIEQTTPAAIEETLPSETIALPETSIPAAIPEETVALSELMDETSITIKSYEGEIGGYSFFACNETQVFGDYSIYEVTYAKEDYRMLSYNGVALLAKEDGSDAKLFYNDQRLDLPFSCDFNLEYKFLSLHEGDFTGTGERQLALIIPVETGSGINIEQLQVINLDTMSLIPLYTEAENYEESIYTLFEGHFAETGMNREYYLFDYVRYSITDDQILAVYGASDEDDIYLSFLECPLVAEEDTLILGPDIRFHDEA